MCPRRLCAYLPRGSNALLLGRFIPKLAALRGDLFVSLGELQATFSIKSGALSRS
jgi:hypothetical protein